MFKANKYKFLFSGLFVIIGAFFLVIVFHKVESANLGELEGQEIKLTRTSGSFSSTLTTPQGPYTTTNGFDRVNNVSGHYTLTITSAENSSRFSFFVVFPAGLNNMVDFITYSATGSASCQNPTTTTSMDKEAVNYVCTNSFDDNDTITFDFIIPFLTTVDLTTTATNPTNISPIPVTVTFSRPVSGFVLSDVVTTNCNTSSLTGSGANYIVWVIPTTGYQGEVTVSIPADKTLDANGNNISNVASTAFGNYAVSRPFSLTYDSFAPTVTIACTYTNPTKGPIPCTATFSESVAGFDSTDITLPIGSISDFSGSGTTYAFTINFPPDVSGSEDVHIAANKALDAAGNGNVLSNQPILSYDTKKPTVNQIVTTSPTTVSPISLELTFSEVVTNVNLSDISVTNGIASLLAGSGDTYTFKITPSASGLVTYSIQAITVLDAASNFNDASPTFNFTYLVPDTTPPTVVLTSTATNPTTTSPIPITATFSESITGFALTDLSVTNGSASNLGGSGTTYTFKITPTAVGPVTVSIPANSVVDTANNGNTASAAFNITYNTPAPSVVLTSTATNPTLVSPIPMTATFSASVTGFDNMTTDIIVTNGSLSNLVAVSGTTYTFEVSPAASGSVTVSIPADSAEAGAGNNNVASAPFTIVYNQLDTTAPTVVLASLVSDPTNITPIPMTATFSESVGGLIAADITVSNGTAKNLIGSGLAYSFDLVPAGTGLVTVSIPAEMAQDSSGNKNTASNSFSINYVTAGSNPNATILGGDTLLTEYLFPISSYEKVETPIIKKGSECDGFKRYEQDWADAQNCTDLPAATTTDLIKKWTDGSGVLTNIRSNFRYTFNVAEQSNYVFKINASNNADIFSKLTRQQLDYILNGMGNLLDLVGDGITEDDLTELGISELRNYELFRSMVFSVYVDGTEPANKKGFIFVKNTNPAIKQDGEIVIGNLTPGEHTIYLQFLSDFNYDFSGITGLPTYFNNFSNADLNADKKLDVNPVIYSVAIDKMKPADDIIGIRIYKNLENKDALSWYNEHVINPTPDVESLTVDGYNAIKDDRTVYVNAANVLEKKVCLGGADDGKECTESSECRDAVQCNLRKFFYSNIYVIAYNQKATPSSVNISNQMLQNWTFNINLDPLKKEEIKAKLRRDLTRLSDLRKMKDLLEIYRQEKGKYPVLEAGTFIKGHSISTWPSWQSTMGNELGSALPLDPLNIMTPDNRVTYKCTNPLEAEKCINICSRDAKGNAQTGCPANQQCVKDEYCSICPPGFDAKTCWDEVQAKASLTTYSGCQDMAKLNGAFNLGGTSCSAQTVKPEVYDGAYVYQYTALDLNNDGKAGEGYLLNYRLEFTEGEICSPGQCVFNNVCYQPGSCLAQCGLDQTTGNYSCKYPQYKNMYCYLGTWLTSCGDGFVQGQCGEFCDPARTQTSASSWCDLTYDEKDWYNESNIKGTCSNQCTWQGFGDISYVPQRYTPQTDDIDCGGYCGDTVVQALYKEQCDEGIISKEIKRPDQNGSGGISSGSQYMCSGLSAGKPMVKTATECENYKEYNGTIQPCASMPTTGWVQKYNGNQILASGEFNADYQFNIGQIGNYTIKIKTANLGDKISELSDQQLDFIIALKQNPDIVSYLNHINADGSLAIPDYPEVSSGDNARYTLLRSLIYSVYLDNNKVGYITMPATNQDQPQEGLISLGALTVGSHTVDLHFIGDHFWLPFADLEQAGKLSLPAELNNFANADTDNNKNLDINPIIYSVSLFSPELGVGNCQSFGGWCGDTNVQLEYGEQCDINNYLTPSPSETVNIIRNSSFENVLAPWEISEGSVKLNQSNYFEGRYGLEVTTTGLTTYLKQPTKIFKDEPYNVSLMVKPFFGTIDKIAFEIGDQSKEGWNGEQVPLSKVATQTSGWDVYQLENYQLPIYGYKLRFIFTTSSTSSFYLDAVKLIPQDVTARPQYLCGNQGKKMCQYKAGYCGDGIIQNGTNDTLDANETCDDRVGLSCATDQDCGAGGVCDTDINVCTSKDCNDICKSTFCGDSNVQRPNSYGINESCDWGSNPLCSSDCQHIKIGGDCTSDMSHYCDPNSSESCQLCASGLSCTIRNFGDTDKKCLGARGSYGCQKNSDCILGYYCDISTTKCEPEISTYLKYHPEEPTILTLPSPSDASYDVNLTSCPDLMSLQGEKGEYYVTDRCTGISWLSSDNISSPNWSYREALEDACSGATRLPTAPEMYSLVRQTNQGLFYSDKTTLRLCGNSCAYDENETDLCSDCPDDNFLYWTSSCVKRDIEGTCLKALAVNFKYGSIEESNTTSFFKAHCLKDTVCGNSIIEEGENCEFYKANICQGGDNDGKACLSDADCEDGSCTKGLVEKAIAQKCTAFGYDDGFLHCDPLNCNFKFNNCVLNTTSNQSCQETCKARKALACETVGINISPQSDYYDIIGNTLTIATNSRLMDMNPQGICFVPERNIDCNYRFIDREANCKDADGKFAPYRSEYSYCNCQE